MTEPTPPATQPEGTSALADRLQALQASRGGMPPVSPPAGAPTAPGHTSRRPSGPAPSRILAAATSVAAGIGLVALMAGAQQDIVVQVNPTPITVQPANVIVDVPTASGDQSAAEVQVRVVEPAVPAERPVPQARVISQSEGS